MTDRATSPAPARYVMIGGFLGAGKTTCILRAAERFAAAGLRVGLVTNDQAGGLVDTALSRARDLPVEEIAGGCFCCRFNSLVEAADRLSRDAAPDILLAEPVGSCTDLVATVSVPLARLYGDRFTVAPVSVVVDPLRAMRILGLPGAGGGAFSPNVAYIYRKQLEDMGRICLLGLRKLATFVGHRMVDTGVIVLSQNRRDCQLTGVRRENGTPARIEGAQHRGSRQTLFQPVKAALLTGAP